MNTLIQIVPGRVIQYEKIKDIRVWKPLHEHKNIENEQEIFFVSIGIDNGEDITTDTNELGISIKDIDSINEKEKLCIVTYKIIDLIYDHVNNMISDKPYDKIECFLKQDETIPIEIRSIDEIVDVREI